MPPRSGLKRHHPAPPKTGPKLILPSAAGKAFAEAMHDLGEIAEKYGPLDRRPGVNTHKGLDILDHRFANRPLNKVGTILVAVRKLKQAEDMLAQRFRANMKIASQRPPDTPVDDFIDVLATPSDPRPQRPASETPLPDRGVRIHSTAVPPIHGNILVGRGYLQRLESENHMFRRHLRDLEVAVVDRLERTITEGLKEIVERKAPETPIAETENTGFQAEDAMGGDGMRMSGQYFGAGGLG